MSDDSIKTAIRQLAGTHLADTVEMIVCTVDSVQEDVRTCSCTAINGKNVEAIDNVLLMADIDDGMLYIPAIGSTVIVITSSYNQPYVGMFSELSKIVQDVGSSSISLVDGQIKINDGSFGGLIKISDLVQKMNKIENLLNDLIGKYNIHTHAVAGGTASATPMQETGSVTPTNTNEIENKTVVHGK